MSTPPSPASASSPDDDDDRLVAALLFPRSSSFLASAAAGPQASLHPASVPAAPHELAPAAAVAVPAQGARPPDPPAPSVAPAGLRPAAAAIAPPVGGARETFKVPLPPPLAQSLHGLPADIEHILSLGANEPDAHELPPTSNYEKVVKDLREKAGFGATGADDTLGAIEREMSAGGVPRLASAVEGESSDVDGEAWAPAASTRDGDVDMPECVSSSALVIRSRLSLSSSDDSESAPSDDSDDEPVRPVASTSAGAAPGTNDKGKGKGKGKKAGKRAASEDDLSDDDVNTGAAPTTEHELALPAPEQPALASVPEAEEIVKFGEVASVIDTVVVVKADTAGDWRVFDEGSLCCWADRVVLGNVRNFPRRPADGPDL